MTNEPVTITYRQDYIRRGEAVQTHRKNKEQRHAIYERNRSKATAPDACWKCVHFTDCSCSDARNCEKWRNEE